MNPSTTNEPFFGRKISQQGVNVTQATDNQLVMKEDYNTGTTTYYDASGNPVLINGKLPNGNFGLASNNGQISVSNNGVEQIIIGLLPDGTYGMVISKPGIDVNSVFS